MARNLVTQHTYNSFPHTFPFTLTYIWISSTQKWHTPEYAYGNILLVVVSASNSENYMEIHTEPHMKRTNSFDIKLSFSLMCLVKELLLESTRQCTKFTSKALYPEHFMSPWYIQSFRQLTQSTRRVYWTSQAMFNSMWHHWSARPCVVLSLRHFDKLCLSSIYSPSDSSVALLSGPLHP